jgi:hypothetical protein
MGLLLVPYAVALVALSHPAAEARLRKRIVETLQVQLGGDVVLEGHVRVDPLLRVSFGPLVVVGATRGDPPFLRVERVRATARMSALLAGRVEPAAVELSTARVVIAPAAAGLTALDGERRQAGPVGDESARRGRDHLVVRFRRLVVVAGGNALELGPVDGDVTRERDATGERIALDLHLPGGGRAGLDARRAPGDGWRGRAWASRVGPEVIPPALRGSVAQLADGAVSIAAEGSAPPDLASAEVHVHVGADRILLVGERIGPAPIGPIRAEAEGTLSWDRRDRHLVVAGGRVSLLGTIRAVVDGDVRLVPGHPFSLSLRADGLDFAAAVAALPDTLAPPFTVSRPAGTLDARAVVAGPLLAPSAWTFSAALDLSRMRAAARTAPPVPLRASFVHRPPADGAAPAIGVGPANPDFIPIAELPVHVVRAITTSEDGRFFGHEGFDFEELRNAFAEAVAGRVVRGGSTITQQLAKNLYLTREKTLARKVREAAITVALEATVPKQRLLEIYLNVVEWGPGVWGLGPAARHWFGKDARELTPMEAAFLASIIPNPTRYHFMYERGDVSEAWRRRVDDVLLKMAEQGVLGNEDLARALAEPVVFTRIERPRGFLRGG